MLYLSPSDDGLALQAATGGEAQPADVIASVGGITDYTVAPSGSSVVYASGGVRGSELRAVNLVSGDDQLLHRCPEGVRCQAPAVSPDGNLLAFEMHTLIAGAGGKPVGQRPRVWLLAIDGSGGPAPVGADASRGRGSKMGSAGATARGGPS